MLFGALSLGEGLAARGDLVGVVQKQNPADPSGNKFSKEFIDTTIASEFGIAGLPASDHDALAFKIYYETVDAFGMPTIATGLVTIPIRRPLAPTLCHNHGTTPNDLEVPSQSTVIGNNGELSFDGNVGELFILLSFSGAGYVGIAPDYIGLGENAGFHPYLHVASQAAAVVDAIRAGQSLAREPPEETGTTLSEPDLFITGYSQGGHVTMSAHKEIEENPSLGLSVRASVPAAGSYDLGKTSLAGNLKGPSLKSPFYIAYCIYAYHKIYSVPERLEDFFVAEVATDIPSLLNGTRTTDELIDALPPYTELEKLLLYPSDAEIRARFPQLVQKLEENSTHRWIPKAPILMLYVDADLDVQPENTFVAHGYMSSRGAPVRKQRVGSGFDHNSVGAEWLKVAREYFDSFDDQKLTTYDEWKSNLGNFHQSEIDAGEAVIGPQADLNGDGVSNLICYSLGLEPSLPVQHTLPHLRLRPDGRMEIRLIHRVNDQSLSAGIETVTDLNHSSWIEPDPIFSFSESMNMGGGFEQSVYISALPVSAMGNQFFRLRIKL